MKKRLLSLLLCLVLVVSLFPAAAYAEGEGTIAPVEGAAGADAPGGPSDEPDPDAGSIALAKEPGEEPTDPSGDPEEPAEEPVDGDAPDAPEDDIEALPPEGDELEPANVKCGKNVNWTFYSGSGDLVIYGSGPMYDYSSSSSVPWFEYSSQIKTVEIRQGVTSIGNFAFYSCYNLTSVTIPAGVTSIGNYAFRGCSRLTSVEIPEGVTSIGNYAFQYCSKLTSVEIPASVTSIGDDAFRDCSGLTAVYIEDLSAWCAISFSICLVRDQFFEHVF